MILGAETITRRRFAVGSRGADGRWVDGATTDVSIAASVQPLEGKDRAILPEGDRSKDGIKLYTTSDLVPADQHAGTSGDRVVVNGVVFEVRNVVRERSIIPHYRAFALRLQEVAP